MNEEELRNLMYTAQSEHVTGPMAIRYPRGQGVMLEWQGPFSLVPIGTGRKLRDGKDLAFLSIGHVGNVVSDVCRKLEEEGVSPAQYDLRFVKPLDDKLLQEVFTRHKKVITVEDGCIAGGMGSAVLEWMADHGYQAEVRRLGIPDRIIEHGEPKEQYAECGYDETGILTAARAMLSSTSR
jgi:1-deoxy-D-xylulose-5-phosphate synthase